MALTHNSKTADQEPAWSEVDKTRLPRKAFADQGDPEKKSSWGYPHHWVKGGEMGEDDGGNKVYVSGDMYLHEAGLDAAWAAAQGARGGEEASQAVKDHLQQHRRALGKADDDNDLAIAGQGMPKKIKGQAPQRLARLRKAESEHIDLRIRGESKAGVDIYLYDVIGWPFIEAQDLLYQVPQDTSEIRVHINSPGGDVFEGMAIYNFLSSHKAEVSVSVDSLAASSASLVAMAGARISMAKASFLMIHNPWSIMIGDAEDLRKEAELLDKISDVFANAYSEKSGRDKQEILGVMQAETWFTPDEALEGKLADEILQDGSGTVEASAAFDLSIFDNVPQALRQGSASRQARTTNSMEDAMDKKLRALLERLGLPKEASEEQAWAYWKQVDTDQLSAADKQTVQDPQGGGDPAGGGSQKDPDQAARDAVKAEKQRQAEIRESVTIAGLDDAMAEQLIEKDCSLDEARQQILAKMKETNPPLGAGGIQVGADETDKFRNAIADGVCIKAGARPEQPAQGAEDFRAATLEHVARICLERAGVNVRNLGSRDEIARTALRQAASGGFSTDDFSSIFLDVAHKTLLKAYQEAPNTWRPIVNVVSASDFKTIYGVGLSEAPDLDLVDENGEYKSGGMTDRQESYSVATYGKIVYLTRQMIVNDDLRAFTRLPQLLGAAARRKEGDLVWGKITGNPTMSDGNALFSAAHNNLESTDVGNVSSSLLQTARASMRKQTGPGGATLDLQPAFLLVPVAQETDAEVLLRSTMLPVSQANADYNPWANRLVPIAEPRLDNDSADAWYLTADPAQVDTIEVAYLDGREAPYTEEEPLFERDAIGYKVRHDLGVGPMEWRGFYKNVGK